MLPIVPLREILDAGAGEAAPAAALGVRGGADGPGGRILGAHLPGHNTGEAINISALAMRHGLSLADLHETDRTCPTATHEIDRVH